MLNPALVDLGVLHLTDLAAVAFARRNFFSQQPPLKVGQRWRTENPEAMKARSRRWYENNRERLPSSRKNNRERLNDYWRSYYAKNKEQINQRIREQRQRKRGQKISRVLGPGTRSWDQASEKLETNLVPSKQTVTLCEIST